MVKEKNYPKSILPQIFYGNKEFLYEHYKQLEESQFSIETALKLIKELFPYQSGHLSEIYENYMILVMEYGVQQKYSFEKLSCLIELSYYVFKKSMSQRLQMQKSFNLFKRCLVRHSLFRPPQCVLIYSLEEIKSITRFFQNSFFKHYLLYLKSFTSKVDIEINTFNMFEQQFEETWGLSNEVDKNDVEHIREYLVDKEIGLTQKELEEIMKGDSIHMVPMSKRLEWQKQKEERKMQEKIKNALQKELDQVNQEFLAKCEEQDKMFKEKMDQKTTAKKK